MHCFDTDVLAAVLRPDPPLHLVRRLARTPASEQCTTSVALAEIAYATARNGDVDLVSRLREVVAAAQAVVPFEDDAATVYGWLRAELERSGKRLDETSLRIASIALARDMTLVTGRAALYRGIPGLRLENWLEPDAAEHPPAVDAEGGGASTSDTGPGKRSDGRVRHPGMLRTLDARVRALGHPEREDASEPPVGETGPEGPAPPTLRA